MADLPAVRKPGVPVPVLAAISAGGVLGALARYGLNTAFPYTGHGFPWTTFAVNVSGCLLIGVLMAVVEALPVGPLVRPFLGTGILGGYTTFSTAMVDTQHLLAAGATRLGLAYLAGTALAALLGVSVGSAAARAVLRVLQGGREP